MKRLTKWDWKSPDYAAVWNLRFENLKWLKGLSDADFATLKNWYRLHPEEFIQDWGVTFDPRNAEVNLPTLLPFILFPKQKEWVQWVVGKWRERRPGLCEKSRDMGVTWLSVGLASTLCMLYDGVAIGFGSRKTEYVDKIGTMKPILPKARMFMMNVPVRFRPSYRPMIDAPYMRISFPDTGSIIAGEGGDDIGRGDRTSIYFFDEEAHHPRQDLVAASLSQTTNCQIGMSSVRGMNNLFAQKRHAGKIEVFIFDWHDDPRKDQEWYDKQCENLDPVVVAQEIDRDYSASVKGIVIPGEWVRAAIDAKDTLQILVKSTGARALSFDVADEGDDKNALGVFEGIEILEVEEWSGKGSDIFASTEYVFDVCDDYGIREFHYDQDGLGAGVGGDARIINERRVANKAKPVQAHGFRGSSAVIDPEGVVEGTIGSDGEKGRLNQDYFGNAKAQGWWALRKRFQRTFRWVQFVRSGGKEGAKCEIDEIISIRSKHPTDPKYSCMKLVAELTQVIYRQNELGKLIIEKKPDGMKSPNLADTVMIHFAPKGIQPIDWGAHSAEIATLASMGRRR